MWSPTKSTKCCATCIYWQGYRKDKKSHFEVESPGTRAKCSVGALTMVTPGPTASEGRNCKKYVKLGQVYYLGKRTN